MRILRAHLPNSPFSRVPLDEFWPRFASSAFDAEMCALRNRRFGVLPWASFRRKFRAGLQNNGRRRRRRRHRTTNSGTIRLAGGERAARRLFIGQVEFIWRNHDNSQRPNERPLKYLRPLSLTFV